MELVLLTSVIALCTPLIRSQLLSSPMNTIAKIGQRVELNCSTNATLPLTWDFADVNSTRFEHTYRNEIVESKFSSRYDVYNISSSVERHWVLVINSVDIYHAGTYKCGNAYEPKVIQMNATAQLAVIDSEPVCGTNASNSSFLEGDFIHIWCKVNYSGNYILVMEWTRNDGQTVDTYTRSYRGSIKVTSSLIKELASSDNNVTFTCKTSLNLNSTNGIPAGVDITKATNIIYYQYSWNYTAIVYHETLLSTAATPSNGSNGLAFETILIIGTSIGALILALAIAVIICKIRKIGVKEAKTIDAPDQPTYGIVKKNRKDEQEHPHREEDVPVYGEVKKNKKDKKTAGKTSKNSSTTEKKPNQNYTGADGTVYEEMSAFADRKFNKTPVKQAPLFDLVDIYASIDHTTAAPPPTH